MWVLWGVCLQLISEVSVKYGKYVGNEAIPKLVLKYLKL